MNFIRILMSSIILLGLPAEEFLSNNNEYFSADITDGYIIAKSGGKENQQMIIIRRSEHKNLDERIAITMFADSNGLDPNEYLKGDTTVLVNGMKWVWIGKDSKWWGIKNGDKYKISLSVSQDMGWMNPIVYSMANSIIPK